MEDGRDDSTSHETTPPPPPHTQSHMTHTYRENQTGDEGRKAKG